MTRAVRPNRRGALAAGRDNLASRAKKNKVKELTSALDKSRKRSATPLQKKTLSLKFEAV